MIFFNNAGTSTITVSHNDPDVESVTVEITVERKKADFIVSLENRATIGYTDSTEELIIPSTFVGDDNVQYNVVGIDTGAFSKCTNLKSITIPDTVTTIGSNTFNECEKLNMISIDNTFDAITGKPWGASNTTEVIWLKSPIATSCRLDGFDPDMTYNEGDSIKVKLIPLPEGTRFPFVGDDNTSKLFVNRAENEAGQNGEILEINMDSKAIYNITFLSTGSAKIMYGFMIDNDNNYHQNAVVNVAAIQHYQVTFDDDCNEVSAYPGSVANEDDKSGAYRAGRRVKISCKDSAIEHFVQWSCDDTSLVFEDKTNPTTYFIMPDHDIVIDHTFVTYNVTLSGAGVGATGNGEYVPGNTVTITPGTKAGFKFAGYTCTNTAVQTELNDETTGTFTMPEVDVEVVANWEELVPVDFTVTTDNRAMVGYTGAANEELIIPATFTAEDGVLYKVVGIGHYAFDNCTLLSSIDIPNSVTSIGSYAFRRCTLLESITIPNSITSIGNAAFNNCTSLESVVIPDSVKIIDHNTFQDCTALTSITISEGVTSIGNSAFRNCALTSIDIPNSVTSIGSYAFADTQLKSIILPDTITSISNNAIFFNCTALTSITLPNTLRIIGSNAFYGCSSLTNINIPNSVTSINNDAFYKCTKLRSINIPNGVTCININTFSGCTSLTSVTLPNTVTSINSLAFKNCSALTSIDIPNSVTSIYYNAFDSCVSLTTINVDNTINAITDSPWNAPNATVNWLRTVSCQLTVTDSYAEVNGNGVYYEGTEVTINAGTRDEYTFAGWTCNNSSVVFTDSSAVETTFTMPGEAITVVANWEEVLTDFIVTAENRHLVGYVNEDVTNLTIPSSVTVDGVKLDVVGIGDSAFEGCRKLESVIIPDTVTSIGKKAFKDAAGYSGRYMKVTLSKNLTSMGESAFENCFIQSINIPGTLKTIPLSAFSDCLGLSNVTINEGVELISNWAFAACISLRTISIPSSVNTIYGNVFINSTNVTKIYVNKKSGAISGSPWGAKNATVSWLG